MALACSCLDEQQAERSWQASLQLRFAKRSSRTALVRRQHYGPLCVQKPFYPESDDVCHVYVLHPPAGIAGGDSLSIEVEVDEQAHALMTTPAATKFYRANPYVGSLIQSIKLAADAKFEWLPQENILFNGAKARLQTRLDIHTSSRFIFFDSQCLGRRASAELFVAGECKQRLEIWREGEPLFIDAYAFAADSDFQRASWGLANNTVNSLLVAYPATDEMVDVLRAALQTNTAVDYAVTLLDEVLLIRSLANDSETMQNTLRQAWGLLRPLIFNRVDCPPRIWNT